MSSEGVNNPRGKEIFNYLFNVKQKVLVFHLDEFRDKTPKLTPSLNLRNSMSLVEVHITATFNSGMSSI